MSSIVIAVFKLTIGLLGNRFRDKIADSLKEGDMTDQSFRDFIVREIKDIKSKLDGLARKDLLASISFFNEGIKLLYEVFDEARPKSENNNAVTTTQAATALACAAETFSLTKGMNKLEVANLNASASGVLSRAKDRFRDARRKATEAFANTALSTFDRLLAMQYRVMATILETLDNPVYSIAACRVCLEELNSLPAVQKCFKVELEKGFKAAFRKDVRSDLISTVCHTNRVIFNVALMVDFGNKELSNWPCVEIREIKVSPLQNDRVLKVLRKRGMEHCFGTLELLRGEDGSLVWPVSIASNSLGQFVVANGNGDKMIKFFDSRGEFLNCFPVVSETSRDDVYCLCQVATDSNGKIYALVELKPQVKSLIFKDNNTGAVHVFDWDFQPLHKFSLKEEFSTVAFRPSLTVNDKGKVLILLITQPNYSQRKPTIQVYQSDGRFVNNFGDGILKSPVNIAAASEGRTLVTDNGDSCVHVFNEHGEHIFKLTDMLEFESSFYTAFHWPSEHVVVAGFRPQTEELQVLIYTMEGKIVRHFEQTARGIRFLAELTVTVEGRIGILAMFKTGTKSSYFKVLVI
ncbi:uncharacterized protein LOC111337699 [Stylophora pistillata]|uniref:Tripartite motif-containing protein 2 n=1 Tax=Stylophora pistillata TaxID=50429 RepID=A0A2B4RU19_STYPI|nr:uncharacterized protein LOC111337699 [Stylophora pistillata]PFX19818.1 Tripartite motif-containing protein 2 [Stylophora pistillata]